MRARSLLFPLILLPLCGCPRGIDLPTAYEDQRYLCAPEHEEAWKAAVAECRQRFDRDRDCAGVVSYQGRLEETPLRVESWLSQSSFLEVVGHSGSQAQLADVEATGRSPYFLFTLKLRSLGGAANAVFDNERRFVVDPRSRSRPDALGDLRIEPSLRLSVGGESVDLAGLDEAGEVVITHQAPTEVRGSFDAAFGSPGDRVEGCFVIFPLERNTVLE